MLEDLAEAVYLLIRKCSKSSVENFQHEGLAPVLSLTQGILTDGTLRTDFLGRPECRTFVLDTGEEDARDVNLFGSANIESWLHLQLCNKRLTQKLRDLYSNKARRNKFYRKDSVSRDPELRQTFLLVLESLELLDQERLLSLNILRKKHGRPKSSRNKTKKKSLNNNGDDVTYPRSRQLELLDAVESDRRPASLSSSQPNLPSLLVQDFGDRRTSFPNQKNLLVNKSESDLSSGRSPGYAPGLRTQARARPDSSDLLWPEDTGDTGEAVQGAWARALPASTGWSPRPRPNQSLLQWLSEAVVSGRGERQAELDRENAHFLLAETVISTFEEVSCARSLDLEDPEAVEDEDDEEIRRLQSEIRRRRGERRLRLAQRERRLSDGGTDSLTQGGTTDQSASPGYSDTELRSELSDAMLDSGDEDFAAAETSVSTDMEDSSAESIALTLLSQVGSCRLPPADRLPWLVTRAMVDQALLPLPSSLPVDPDTELLMSGVTELRGTLTWAPPRPQIVLTVQPVPDKRTLALSSQKWMCAGCGMRVEQRYSRSYRWCHYLGKYFCTGCHSNTGHLIPARVIHHWDFKKYPVSNFALEILTSMTREPVFNIGHLNPGLFRRVERLKQVASLRQQLSKLARYVSNCRLAGDLQPAVEAVLVAELEMFSLEDVTRTRAGELGPALRRVMARGLEHVRSCDLCQARGHLCTLCQDNTVIYPFMAGVMECGECCSCYHRACYTRDTGCPKCWRRLVRQQQRERSVDTQ